MNVEDAGLDNDFATTTDNESTNRTFEVIVNAIDAPPTLDPIGDVTIEEDADRQTVNLTGISDGDQGAQTLRITASSNDALIASPQIQYPLASSSQSFAFATDVSGWTNQPTEPFSVSFTPTAGNNDSGMLKVSGTARNSYQLVHAWDATWPATTDYEKITFDILFEDSNTEIIPGLTGFKIKQDDGQSSIVYLASKSIDLPNGFKRIELTASDLTDLPLSHNDIGLNLHIQTSTSTSVLMYVDNIQAYRKDTATLFLLSRTQSTRHCHHHGHCRRCWIR